MKTIIVFILSFLSIINMAFSAKEVQNLKENSDISSTTKTNDGACTCGTK